MNVQLKRLDKMSDEEVDIYDKKVRKIGKQIAMSKAVTIGSFAAFVPGSALGALGAGPVASSVFGPAVGAAVGAVSGPVTALGIMGIFLGSGIWEQMKTNERGELLLTEDERKRLKEAMGG